MLALTKGTHSRRYLAIKRAIFAFLHIVAAHVHRIRDRCGAMGIIDQDVAGIQGVELGVFIAKEIY